MTSQLKSPRPVGPHPVFAGQVAQRSRSDGIHTTFRFGTIEFTSHFSVMAR